MDNEPVTLQVKKEKGDDAIWTLGEDKYTREDIKACFEDK